MSEKSAASDILQILPYNELLPLINVLKTGGSLSVYAHYFILNLHNWYQKLGSHEAYPLNLIEVLVPVAGIQNGTFVCFDKTGKFTENYIYFFTIPSDCLELKECLQETNLIDWKNEPLFGAVHSNHLPTLHSILSGKSLPIASEELLYYYNVSTEVLTKFEDNVPAGLEIRDLDESFALTLDKGWIFSNEKSLKAIQSNVRLNGAMGLFNKTQNKLLGWVTMNEHMALGLLRVVDSEKRKGFAKILVKQYCKKFVADEGLLPLTFVAEHNYASVRLFDDLKFNVLGKCFWVATGTRSFQKEYES